LSFTNIKYWTVVFEEDKVDEQVEESEEDGKFLMLRIVWFSIFFNCIEEHGQKEEVKESEEDDEGKLLMLRIVWFSIF